MHMDRKIKDTSHMINEIRANDQTTATTDATNQGKMCGFGTFGAIAKIPIKVMATVEPFGWLCVRFFLHLKFQFSCKSTRDLHFFRRNF